jgi:Cdc6-like AAA superfamily ATPase
MEGRKTTEEEDMTYALFGILNVSLAVIYGERGRARDRLLAVIREREELELRQAKQYREISSWVSPTDPWENHRMARKQHEPATGAWLLQSEMYRAWKAGSDEHRHLWLYGPAGSGKTILCSTAIEDVQVQCRNRTNVGQAIFYFSFSDQTKQTYESLVRSIVVQLGCKEPGISLLRQAYERPEHKIPGADELQRILAIIVRSYDQIFLHLDGLDECLGEQDARLDILASLEMLSQTFPKIRMIATSRDYPEIRSCMEAIQATLTPLDRQAVDSDIQRFVSTQLAKDMHIRQWPAASRKLVEETLAQKAQGM